jgi:Neuraminidase (sialidase)
MTRNILAVPDRSVGVKHLFSAAGNICHYTLGQLMLDTVWKLVMMQHHDATELAAEELETEGEESTNTDNCYKHHNLHCPYDRTRALAASW